MVLRDVYGAVLRGFNHLIRFASYLAEMDGVVEDATPGEFESELLEMIGGFQTSLNPFIARNPYLRSRRKSRGRIDTRDAGEGDDETSDI